MSSGLGRGIRVIAGLILIALGLFSANGTPGLILIAVGAIPLIAGLLDMCFIGALFFRAPLRGAAVRITIKE
ncbi:MAG: DUF2892 domain-containing protein [Anaerolineales bacterium]|nr:MAG: DUF2892 domain-containing protein [Anaerolineales bacterium]